MTPIDFIQADDLPWTDDAGLAAGEPPAARRLRSSGEEVVALVDLVAGRPWQPRPGQLVSFLVLGGRVEVAGGVHGHLGFAQVCTDGATTFAAPDGARLLVFSQPGRHAPAALAKPVDTLEVQWEIAEDPVAGIWRELTLTAAGNPAGAIALRSLAIGDSNVTTHRHDWDEDVYVVDGERLTPAGAMTAGCYAWRPRGVWHGGFRTGSPGALLLVRRTGETAALAATPELSPDPLPATRLRREARLTPAAAAVTDLWRHRDILTGRRE